MKADKNTLMGVKNFLELRQGWSLDEVKDDIVSETGLLKHKEVGDLFTDECGIEWDGDNICVLEEFIDMYTDIFIKKICNVLDSFIDENLDYYLENTDWLKTTNKN